jgi:hypothetical protein
MQALHKCSRSDVLKARFDLSKLRLPALLLCLCSLIALLPGCGGSSSSTTTTPPTTPPPTAAGTIPVTYFDQNLDYGISTGQVAWPPFPVGSIRLWGTVTTWADIEPLSPSNPDWSGLDNWLSLAASKGIASSNIMYTFGEGTPPWISSDPTDPTCSSAPGWCDPPSDVDSGDTSFKNFVTALLQHVGSQIGIYECINEANAPNQWTGTVAQTLTMCTDMYNIVKQYDPAAIVAMPPVANGDGNATVWLTQYFQAGGAKVADTVGFHGYARPDTDPDLIYAYAQSIVALAKTYAPTYPVWDTEVGFFNTLAAGEGGITDPDQQAAYTAIIFLTQWGLGIPRVYWYSYGNGATGTLSNTAGTVLNTAGTAYTVVQQWLLGATMNTPCSENGTTWTCSFKNAQGSQVEAVWEDCTATSGVCPAANFTQTSGYSQYVDLTGTSQSFSAGATVPIGTMPILLEP